MTDDVIPFDLLSLAEWDLFDSVYSAVDDYSCLDVLGSIDFSCFDLSVVASV